MLTMSGLERAMNCQASELLPHVKSADTSHKKGGRVVHAFLKNCNLYGRDKALEMAPDDEREALAAIDVDALPLDGDKYAPEVSFAYEPESDTARELARGDDSRSYPDGPFLCGTSDLIGVTPDAVIVGDWKGPHADLTPAAENWQLKGYAVAAARAYGRRKAIVFLGRIRDDGTPFFDHAEYSMFELDAAAETIRELWLRLKTVEASVTIPAEGTWCKWCPAFNRCPAKASLAASLGAGTTFAVGDPATGAPMLYPGNARAVYERLQAAKMVVARVDEVLEEYARTNTVDLGNGFVYGEVERPRENLDPVLAEPILQAAGLNGAIEVTAKLTKSGLEDAVRRATSGKPRGALGKTMKATLEALRNAGASTTARQRVVMKHKLAPGEATEAVAKEVTAERARLKAEHSPAAEPVINGDVAP